MIHDLLPELGIGKRTVSTDYSKFLRITFSVLMQIVDKAHISLLFTVYSLQMITLSIEHFLLRVSSLLTQPDYRANGGYEV